MLMFDRVMDWLEAEPEGHEEGFGDHDTQVCVAALFYHMIAVDGVVTVAELKRLRDLLGERYALDDSQLGALTREGEVSDRESAGLFPFTVILNREMELGERRKVYDQLTTLAMADGELHELERDMLEHVRALLKLDSG